MTSPKQFVANHLKRPFGMRIGHIYLSNEADSSARRFVRLVQMLALHGFEQHVIVRNTDLIERLERTRGVSVEANVRTPVSAFCMMPSIDVVHLHDRSSWQAGLLFVLTKSVPYVLTALPESEQGGGAVATATQKRATALIDPEVADVVTHIQVYRQAAENLKIPTMLL